MDLALRRRIIFLLFGLTYLIVCVQRMGMAVINPALAGDLGFSPDRMGVLGSVGFYAYSVTIIFSGFLAIKFGPRKAISIALALAGTGAAFFSTCTEYGLLLLAIALLGCGAAFVVTSATVIFSRWFSMREFALLMALFFLCGGLGAFVGTKPLSVLVSSVGWRYAFSLIAWAMLGMALLAALLIRDFPPAGARGQQRSISLERADDSMLRALGRVVHSRNFWCMAVWFCTIHALYPAFCGVWAGMYLTDVYGLSLTESGGILMMGAVGFTFGGSVLVFLCNRVFHSYRVGVAFMNLLCVAGVAMLVCNIDSLSVPMLYLAVLLISWSPAPSAVLYATTRSLFGSGMAGALAGVWSFATFGGGGVLSMLIGMIVNAGTQSGLSPAEAYRSAFLLFPVCVVVGTMAALLLEDVYGTSEDEPAC